VADVNGVGFSKALIELSSTPGADHLVIQRVTADSAWQDLDWPVGDAGFDLKSCTTVVKNCTVTDAKRSVRKHSGSCNDTVMVDHLTSRYPDKRGGSGNQAHVSANSGKIALTNSTLFDDRSARTVVLDAELEASGIGSVLSIGSGAITKLATAPMTTKEGASTATISASVTLTSK
jgi:hypothetical protein